jgi:hypothetical protein
MDAVIIGNFDVENLSIIPNFPYTGWWYNYFSGDSILVENTTAMIPLEPGEFNIYTSKSIPSPGDDILADVKKEDTKIATEYQLYQNYPNPFNPSTVIEYSIPSNVERLTSEVNLIIYDVLGREMVVLVNEEQPAGRYKVTFDADGLPSGIYFYQLRAGSFIESKKMILLK